MTTLVEHGKGSGLRKHLARAGASAAVIAATVGPMALTSTAGAATSDRGLGAFGVSSALATSCSSSLDASKPGYSKAVCPLGADLFVVPPGVHQLLVDVVGAAGGAGGGGSLGGGGAEITASIMVGPGEPVDFVVGGAGTTETGGFNGGGAVLHSVATGLSTSGGGGGTSDIRIGGTGPWQRILSAAGGGGAGGGTADRHGGQGGPSGLAGTTGGGRHTGGPGGFPATSAGNGAGGGSSLRSGGGGSTTALTGGPGGPGAAAPTGGIGGGDGGGGGGGYGYGGGGAGGGPQAGGGGGGGGSDFVNPALLVPGSSVTSTDGTHQGDGLITFDYQGPPAA